MSHCNSGCKAIVLTFMKGVYQTGGFLGVFSELFARSNNEFTANGN